MLRIQYGTMQIILFYLLSYRFIILPSLSLMVPDRSTSCFLWVAYSTNIIQAEQSTQTEFAIIKFKISEILRSNRSLFIWSVYTLSSHMFAQLKNLSQERDLWWIMSAYQIIAKKHPNSLPIWTRMRTRLAHRGNKVE